MLSLVSVKVVVSFSYPVKCMSNNRAVCLKSNQVFVLHRALKLCPLSTSSSCLYMMGFLGGVGWVGLSATVSLICLWVVKQGLIFFGLD